MAMDKDILGAAWTLTVKASAGATPIPVDEAALLTLMTALAANLILHIQTQADIALLSSDIKVLPGTFVDSLAAPIAGQGVSDATVLPARIK